VLRGLTPFRFWPLVQGVFFLKGLTPQRVVELVALRTLTRHGAREAYHRLQAQMMNRHAIDGAPTAEDAMLVASRVERGRVAEQVRIPFGPDDPDAGVREPRRPRPPDPRSASAACS
jgi:hypothetical protein